MSLSSAEEDILASIVVASEDDPTKPEFPADTPKFPASETYQIEVEGFSNVWLKDESTNPTGTHKDRMAWEIVVTYRDFLIAKKRDLTSGQLPTMSIISSGSAAIAIQTQLNKYNLPNLKVLVDTDTDKTLLTRLKELGCIVYKANLRKSALNWKEILELTDNPNGFDITSSEALDPTTRFYDWLSYEILNSSPDYCFIPFGTGNLFENILNINKKEICTIKHDPRFSGDTETLSKCNFIGATTDNSQSKADKLYSPHLPFVHYDEQWIRLYKTAGYCGHKSGVQLLDEHFLDEAIMYADKNNIMSEPSGIAGLAMLFQMAASVGKDAKILVVNTGMTNIST